MWNVSLLFLLYIYKYNSLWKKKYFCSVKVQCEFCSDKLYSHFVSCFDKKNNKKNLYQEKASSNLNKSKQHSCQ